MSFVIATDTSANLPKEEVIKYGIAVVPFSFFINGEETVCGEGFDFEGDAFYKKLTRDTDVKTSLINDERYCSYFEPILREEKDILYLGMSSGISGAFCASLRAAQNLREKYPERKIICVDTLGASLGEGLQVLTAARLRESGLTIEETATLIQEKREKMCQLFTVDDLMFLKNGGRVSGVAAVFGTVLQIKPLLKGDKEGKIAVFGKVRGRMAAIKALAAEYLAKVTEPRLQTVGIAHAGCPEDAKLLADMLSNSKKPPKSIMTVCYEPVTGIHTGPGTVALFFTGKQK
ncbi:MAG: DegV family protein [Oscillospiraceae bacterium]